MEAEKGNSQSSGMKLRQVAKANRWSFLVTFTLLLADASLLILFPLFIGYAVDDVLISEYGGVILLGILGILTLIVGAGRRFFDSRLYARIYQQLSIEVVSNNTESISGKSAHLGFLGEVVEFFENTFPEVVNNSIALVGTIVIIATMNLPAFVGCLIVLGVVLIVYGMSQKPTIRLNRGYNNELEKQVSLLESNEPIQMRWHFRRLMRWNIKLSDLETINFSIIWLFMMVFLVVSIVFSIKNGMTSYGSVFALILYLFQFIENTSVMPVYYQQWLRLSEIMKRLSFTNEGAR